MNLKGRPNTAFRMVAATCAIALLLATWGASQASARPVATTVVTPTELMRLFNRKALPLYPHRARRLGMTGSGVFRMYINRDGTVRAVGVMKSTGHPTLDLAAAGGLYRWRAIPSARVREIDMPVRFTMLNR